MSKINSIKGNIWTNKEGATAENTFIEVVDTNVKYGLPGYNGAAQLENKVNKFNPMYNSDSPVNIGQVINPNTVMKVNVEKMATWARNCFSEKALNWQFSSEVKHLFMLEFTQVPKGNLDGLYGDYMPYDEDTLGFSGRLYVTFNMYNGNITFYRGYFDPAFNNSFQTTVSEYYISTGSLSRDNTINAFINELLQFGNFDMPCQDMMKNYSHELEQPLYMLTRVMALQTFNPEDESFDSQNLQMVNIDGVDFIEFEQQTVNS